MNLFESDIPKRLVVTSQLIYQLSVAVLLALLMPPAANLSAQVVARVQNQDQNAAQNPVEPLLRRIYRNERKFVSRVCNLTEDQERQVDSLEVDWKAESAKFGPVANAANARGIVMGGARILRPGASTPFQLLDKFRASTRKRFSEVLSDEQREAYKAELTAREDFQRRADAECLMVLISHVMAIRPEQVPSLTDALATWDGARTLQMDNYLLMFGNGGYYLPNIPEELVFKHLDANQRSVFRGIQKADIQRAWIPDDVAEGEQLGE